VAGYWLWELPSSRRRGRVGQALPEPDAPPRRRSRSGRYEGLTQSHRRPGRRSREAMRAAFVQAPGAAATTSNCASVGLFQFGPYAPAA